MIYKANYKAIIDAQWEVKRAKMDWLKLEDILACILSDPATSEDAKVALSKEAIDAFTKRGHFRPDEYKQEEVY